MKKFFIFAMCAIALASCNEATKKAEAQARAERDSLNQVIAQKDDEINDMMTTSRCDTKIRSRYRCA